MARKKTEAVKETEDVVIDIKNIHNERMIVTIEGKNDLILNGMSKSVRESLTDERNNKGKTIREANKWEDLITAIHWRDELPEDIEYNEKIFKALLMNNAPCIDASGFKLSLGQAVVRNELDKYSTKFDAVVNIIAPKNYIPVTFATHFVEEKLMSPKRGSIVLARRSHFQGWKADVVVECMKGGPFSPEQVVQVINLAGFGIGIGSGRKIGYGRYKVVGVH